MSNMTDLCIYRVHMNKSPLKLLEKKERGRIQGLPNFLGYPQLAQDRVKLYTNFKFGQNIHTLHPNKSP